MTPTKAEVEIIVDEMFKNRLSRHCVFYANKNLRCSIWREIAISIYMAKSRDEAIKQEFELRGTER